MQNFEEEMNKRRKKRQNARRKAPQEKQTEAESMVMPNNPKTSKRHTIVEDNYTRIVYVGEEGKSGGVLSTVLLLALLVVTVNIVKPYIPSLTNNTNTENGEQNSTEKSSQRDRFLEILKGEVGNTNGLKYSNGVAEDWCADFITWGKNKAGISSDVIPDFKHCSVPYDFYKEKGRWYDRGSYNPKVGDLVIFDWPDSKEKYDHVGAITEVYKDGDKTKIKVVNGNPKVAISEYDISDTRIIGYGSPDYPMDLALNIPQNQDSVVLDFAKDKFLYKREQGEREI